jgi:hypothetical protein
MLRSNSAEFTPPTDSRVEPDVALRLLSIVLTLVAVIILAIGVVFALAVVIGGIRAAAGVSRFVSGAGGLAIGMAGVGVVWGLVTLFIAALQALLFWAMAQGIRLLIAIEGRARESALLQRAMLAELRRINSSTPTQAATLARQSAVASNVQSAGWFVDADGDAAAAGDLSDSGGPVLALQWTQS